MKALGGVDAQNQKITNVAAPTAATDGATKAYVDGLISVNPIDLSFFCAGSYNAGEFLGIYLAPRAFTFPANFAGSFAASGGSGPTASRVFNIQRSGSSSGSIGTISFPSGGLTGTFASTGGVAIAIVPGDRVFLTAPTTVDTNMSNISMTLVGIR